MLGEQRLWNRLKEKLKPSIIGQRIESPQTGEGIPDVAYSGGGAHGWIELKFLHSWPKREKTKVRIEHLTPQQRNWIWIHGNAGGKAFLLLSINNREYFLFSWKIIHEIGELDRGELQEAALWSSQQGGWDDLKTILMIGDL